ncbi:MAG: alkaline phosphatase family protein, partial [Candidatus Binatia bacterium]
MSRSRIAWHIVITASLIPALPLRAADDLRVYVVVVDGLHPDEVGPLTPTLSELRTGGTWYDDARAVMIAETLPNHVAMMTGVLPRRNGIPANDYKNGRMQDPTLIESPTLVTRLESPECGPISTATIQSKTYLDNIFRAGGSQKQADFHWQPFPVIPVSDHAPDAATMSAFLDWLVFDDPPTPHFAFVNLGDVDRSGHADPSGNTGLPAFRQAALEHTDTQLRLLVGTLKLTGAWESTVLIITSDHSMDWSLPFNLINLSPVVGAAGQVVQNGGAEMIYLNDASPGNVAAWAGTIEAVDGVAKAVTAATTPSLADLGLDHPNTGHIVAFAEDGWRFSDPSQTSNPIPGNHGHAVTQASVLLVAGGHPALADDPAAVAGTPPSGDDIPDPPDGSFGNLDVAPTVA